MSDIVPIQQIAEHVPAFVLGIAYGAGLLGIAGIIFGFEPRRMPDGDTR